MDVDFSDDFIPANYPIINKSYTIASAKFNKVLLLDDLLTV